MTDSLGGVSYSYDQLSRLTSETRAISGVGTFTLNYTYNLGGELASYTSFGNTVSYTRDVTGRLSGVSGSPFGGVTQYVSNIKYRAWGGRRELTYGNNHTGATQYNNRLLPTSYSLSSAMTRSYAYFADGRLKSSPLAEDGSLNRSYEYDQVGRLDSDTTPTTFAQNLAYDVWGNVTQSNGWHWSQFINVAGTYSNNRNSNWQYNAAGQVTSNQDNTFQYDASGRISHVWTQGGVTDTGEILYDGDGNVVRSSSSLLYNLRSTVLNGRVVAEVLGTGQRARGFVYAEGENVLAIQNEGTNHVVWEHDDPAEQSVRLAEAGGTIVDEREETASGSRIEKQDPYPANPSFTGADTDGQYPFVGTVGKPLTGCVRDGILMPDCSSNFAEMSSFDRFYITVNSETYYYRAIFRARLGLATQETNIGDDSVLRSNIHDTKLLLYSLEPRALWADQTAWQMQSVQMQQSGNRIRNVDSILNKIRYLGDNVNNPDLKSMLQARLMVLLSKDCADAFKRAGLSTPEEIINKGITIASSPLLNDSSNNDTLGISEDIRKKAVQSQAPSQTIRSQFTSKGPIIFFRAEAFSDTAYLDEAVAHEFIHAAGVDKFPLWGYALGRGTDLSGYKPNPDIIANCGFQRVSH